MESRDWRSSDVECFGPSPNVAQKRPAIPPTSVAKDNSAEGHDASMLPTLMNFSGNLPKMMRPSWTVCNIAVAGIVIFFILLGFSTRRVPGFRTARYREATGSAYADDAMNSTLGFEKIFAISLPSRTDHRDALLLTSVASNLQIDWIYGVEGKDVLEKVLPPPVKVADIGLGNVGSWRAHMNALHEVVRQNLSTALIIEDDVDWDVRIKSQLRDYALSSQALLQPLTASSAVYADPTYPSPDGSSIMPPDIDFDKLPPTIAPSSSPYGDGWSVLWLGHCGVFYDQGG